MFVPPIVLRCDVGVYGESASGTGSSGVSGHLVDVVVLRASDDHIHEFENPDVVDHVSTGASKGWYVDSHVLDTISIC